MKRLEIEKALLSLVDSDPMEYFDTEPILRQIIHGMDYSEEAAARVNFRSIIRELEERKEIKILHGTDHITGSSGGVFPNSNARIRSTSERVKNNEDKVAAAISTTNYNTSIGTIHGPVIQGSEVYGSVENSSTFMPSPGEGKRGLFIKRILEIIIGVIVSLVAGYLLYKFGWN